MDQALFKYLPYMTKYNYMLSPNNSILQNKVRLQEVIAQVIQVLCERNKMPFWFSHGKASALNNYCVALSSCFYNGPQI